MSNISEHNGIKYREATSQAMRGLTILVPANVPVDDRGIAELLTCAWKYAGELTYFNESNIPDGNWQDFFTVDPVVGLAVIATQASEKKNNHIGNDKTTTPQNLKSKLADLSSKIICLSTWTKLIPPQNGFYIYLHDLIKNNLVSDIIEFISLSETVFEGYNSGELDKIEYWLSATGLHHSSNGKAQTTDNDDGVDRTEELENKVALLSDSIITIFHTVQSEALKQMHLCLKEAGNHSPHVCLLLSFLSLFQNLQAQLNTVSHKHLNYYFRDLLGFKNNDGVPDKTFVLLGIDPRKKSCKLKKGTGFKAGKDAQGNDLTYRLEKDFTLTTAQVDSVKNIFIKEKNSSSMSVHAGELGFQNLQEHKPGEVELPSQQLFGDEYLEKAPLGFVLSSPLLRLGQGKREITFLLDLKFSSSVSLGAFKDEYARNGEQTNSPENDWLDLHEIFTVECTGEDEWVKIEKPAQIDFSLNTRPIQMRGLVVKDSSTARLKITVLLPPGHPSVNDYNPSLYVEEYTTPWPNFRFTLDQDKHKSLYGLFHELTLFHCTISVDVSGMQDVIIENELGIHDPAKPFMPFGPAPHEGSSFMVGSPEIFQKNIDSLKVSWQWPDAPADFVEYYQGYENFSNIQIKPLILTNGQWEQVGANEFYLKGKRSNNFTLTDIEIAETGEKFLSSPDLGNFTSYDVKLSQGFIKFEISNNDATFGHKEYPELLAKSLTKLPWYKEKYEFAKSLHVIEKIKTHTEVNKPYTPIFQSLMIDYSASQRIDMREAFSGNNNNFKFIRINPFGSEEVTRQSNPYLLPVYRQEAYLYIGLKDMDTSGNISLLFHLADHNSGNSETEAGEIKWSYLMDNRWYDFDPSEILVDSTANLSKTGIVEFLLPGLAESSHSILPGELQWIRGAIAQGSKGVNRVLGIYSQAVQVVFSNEGNNLTHLSSPLPKGTISKTESNIKELKSIIQPSDSFGGQGPEPEEKFYTRVSERLRHKDRAVHVWDYERLILQKFPEIQKVKCLPYTGKNLARKPGEVTIVVIPAREENQKVSIAPTADRALLDQIKIYLQSRVSSAIDVSVINPRFEKVQIEAEVYLSKKGDNEKNRRVLIKTLSDFINPSSNSRDEISFNGVLTKNDIFNLVNSMPFIHEIINLTAIHNDKKHILVAESRVSADNHREIHGSTPASILMSAESHKVKCTTKGDS